MSRITRWLRKLAGRCPQDHEAQALSKTAPAPTKLYRSVETAEDVALNVLGEEQVPVSTLLIYVRDIPQGLSTLWISDKRQKIKEKVAEFGCHECALNYAGWLQSVTGVEWRIY